MMLFAWILVVVPAIAAFIFYGVAIIQVDQEQKTGESIDYENRMGHS